MYTTSAGLGLNAISSETFPDRLTKAVAPPPPLQLFDLLHSSYYFQKWSYSSIYMFISYFSSLWVSDVSLIPLHPQGLQKFLAYSRYSIHTSWLLAKRTSVYFSHEFKTIYLKFGNNTKTCMYVCMILGKFLLLRETFRIHSLLESLRRLRTAGCSIPSTESQGKVLASTQEQPFVVDWTLSLSSLLNVS